MYHLLHLKTQFQKPQNKQVNGTRVTQHPFQTCIVKDCDSYFEVKCHFSLYICNLPAIISYLLKQHPPPAIYLSLKLNSLFDREIIVYHDKARYQHQNNVS